MNDLPARRPGGAARLLLLIASVAGFLCVFAIGFPPASRARLPILLVALALALWSAYVRDRGLVAFGFLFPLAGLGDRLVGGADAIAWPLLLFSGLAAGWTFRFLYDFESAPDPSRADRALKALVVVWSLAAALAVVEARTLWALVRGLGLRAVNVEGLSDASAIRTSMLSYAALAGGVAFFFLLRRAGPALRERTLLASLLGVAASAVVAVAERLGIGPGETNGYWRTLGRASGGAMDPNALGVLCGLGAVVAADRAVLGRGRGRVVAALALACMAAGLALSGSRSGVAVAGIGILALSVARGTRARGRAAALLFGAVLLAGVAVLRVSNGPGSAGERLGQIFDGRLPVEYRASARPVLWASAVRLFEHHPVEGAGLGAFSWQLPNLLAEQGRAGGIHDNPGNAYLQALAETGAVGLVLTAAFAFVLARESWAALRDPGAHATAGGGAAVLAFLVVLSAGSHWFAPDVAFLFFLLAAVTARGHSGSLLRARAGAFLVAVYAVAALAAALGTRGADAAFRYRGEIGFHERESGAGGPFSWTERRFALRVDSGRERRILLAHYTPEGRRVEFTVEADGRVVYSRALEPGQAVALRLAAGRAGPRDFRFTVSRAFVPRRLGVSGDRRELGLIAVFRPEADVEFQFHLASRQAAVRTVVLGARGERMAIAAAGLAALLAVSLWVTVPAVASRAARAEHSASIADAAASAEKGYRDLAARAAGARERALDAGDLVSRAAFLYGVAPAAWPRSLNPEAGVLATADPERLVPALGRYLMGLERGLALVAERETADPTLAAATPSILPLASDLVEPAVRFGPRVSPWTGSDEFFAGMDLAAPAGAPVIAPAAGTVVFAGRVPASMNSRLWRFGNLVVVAHGEAGATAFGHLAKVEVRRGERVRRGQRIGTVGASGWTMFPGLHYELWRPGPDGLAPTDPRFAMLDLRLPGHDVSLEKMRATSAPGPMEPLPGLR